MFYAAHVVFSDSPFEVTFTGTEGEIEVIILVEAEPGDVCQRADALAKAHDGMTLRDRLGQPVVVRRPWVRRILPCVDRDGRHVERLGDGVIAGVTRLAVVTEPESSNVDLDGLVLVEG
jgi:hypothetical protein